MSGHELLKQIVDQIISLEAEHDDIKDQLKDKYDFAKAEGFDVKIIRKVVTEMRKNNIDDFREELVLTETYLDNVTHV